MIIAVQGTKRFQDYDTFMRAMGVALSQPNNEDIIEVWSAGPYKINSFTAAFCNSAEIISSKRDIECYLKSCQKIT